MSAALVHCRNAVKPFLQSIEPGDSFIVAVSGGADSLALAYALLLESKDLALTPIAVTIDHQLQSGSAEQAGRVVSQLTHMGYTRSYSEKVVVSLESGLEAGARDARFAALAKIADENNSSYVFLGHTFNDQAESVLLGLARGSGARSLSAIAPVNGIYIRPFLDVTRQETEQVCNDAEIAFWNDPHNSNRDLLRARVRNEVIPYLEEHVDPGISKALVRTAALLRDDADALDLWSAQFLTTQDLANLDCEALAELPRAVRSRAIRAAAIAAGAIAPTHDQISAIEQMVTAWKGQGELSLSGGVKVARISGRLSLSR